MSESMEKTEQEINLSEIENLVDERVSVEKLKIKANVDNSISGTDQNQTNQSANDRRRPIIREIKEVSVKQKQIEVTEDEESDLSFSLE